MEGVYRMIPKGANLKNIRRLLKNKGDDEELKQTVVRTSFRVM